MSKTGDVAIFSLDARGLMIQGNTVCGPGNGGILVRRAQKGDDGTLVVDNRIEGVMTIARRLRPVGQRHQRVPRCRCDGARQPHQPLAFHGGARQRRFQPAGRRQHRSGLGEVAIYAEFGFEGAVIANNTVDGAALGIVACNLNKGGRLAVVQGNLIRNLKPDARPAPTGRWRGRRHRGRG